MTTFEDGPAKGQTLMLRRAPIFLRVVTAGGVWDALDQPEDEPRSNEAVHVYVLSHRPGSCHIRAAKGMGGFYPIASYRIWPEQPTFEVTGYGRRWTEWVDARDPQAIAAALPAYGSADQVQRSSTIRQVDEARRRISPPTDQDVRLHSGEPRPAKPKPEDPNQGKLL